MEIEKLCAEISNYINKNKKPEELKGLNYEKK